MTATTSVPRGRASPPVRNSAPRTRTAVAVLATAIPALLLVQVYLAGLFLMGGGGEDARAFHVGLGRALQFYPLLLLAVALFARMPRRFWFAFGALWIALIVQAWLPLLSAADAGGWVRALHPLNGFFLVGLSGQVTRLSWALAGEAKRAAVPAQTEE